MIYYLFLGALLCREKKKILRDNALLGGESLAPALSLLGQQAPIHFHHRNEAPAAAGAARHGADDFPLGHPPVRGRGQRGACSASHCEGGGDGISAPRH